MKMNKYDLEWSKAVKILAGNVCEYCRGRNNLNSHHFFGRRYKSTRYDVKNGFCLCANHHMNLAHQRPSEFVLWAIDKRGKIWYETLRIKSNKIKSDISLDTVVCKKIISLKEEL